jgi:hypothetical protein
MGNAHWSHRPIRRVDFLFRRKSPPTIRHPRNLLLSGSNNESVRNPHVRLGDRRNSIQGCVLAAGEPNGAIGNVTGSPVSAFHRRS